MKNIVIVLLIFVFSCMVWSCGKQESTDANTNINTTEDTPVTVTATDLPELTGSAQWGGWDGSVQEVSRK